MAKTEKIASTSTYVYQIVMASLSLLDHFLFHSLVFRGRFVDFLWHFGKQLHSHLLIFVFFWGFQFDLISTCVGISLSRSLSLVLPPFLCPQENILPTWTFCISYYLCTWERVEAHCSALAQTITFQIIFCLVHSIRQDTLATVLNDWNCQCVRSRSQFTSKVEGFDYLVAIICKAFIPFMKICLEKYICQSGKRRKNANRADEPLHFQSFFF